MNLRQLSYFVAVATERNFTRAAERLGIAQPPLSRQIMDLEDELQLQLFDRNSRPVMLTEAGRLLFEHAHRVLGTVAQLKDAAELMRSGEQRPFVIGFVGSTIYSPVPSLIRRFRQAAPNLHVDLVEMNTIGQIEALKDGRIDAGLGRLKFDDPAISRRVIAHERLVAALPTNHSLTGCGNSLSLTQILGETIILYPSERRPSYADQILEIFRDYDLRPDKLREVRELQTALGLVASEAGICIVPESVQRLKRDDIVYFPISEEGAVSPIILSWRATDQSAGTALLISLVGDLFAETGSREGG